MKFTVHLEAKSDCIRAFATVEADTLEEAVAKAKADVLDWVTCEVHDVVPTRIYDYASDNILPRSGCDLDNSSSPSKIK